MSKLTPVLSKRLFWKVELVAKNGETVMTSETYYSKANAERALKRIKKELK